MLNKSLKNKFVIFGIVWLMSSCVPKSLVLINKTENKSTPASYRGSLDSTNTAKTKWRNYFTDPNLVALIDTALRNNQELNITMQEIEISRNEILTRQGEYKPFISLGGGTGVDKVSRFTSQGASDDITEIKSGIRTPEILPNTYFGAFARWEIDIWHKLRNGRKVAVTNYLASVEGKNFQVTNLVSEIAKSYYELMAFDNHLDIIRKNLDNLNNALSIIKQEKEAAKVTELAVRRFEAEVYKNQSLQYEVIQQTVEMENRINFLVGRFPQPVTRNSQTFNTLIPDKIYAGIPAQLIENRPDIRQAALNLEASKMSISIAKANFYPSLGLSAALGFKSFNPIYLASIPESLMAALAGDLMGPLVNKNAITANYKNANVKQIQAVYDFERTVLNACIEVTNQISNIDNLAKKYQMKSNQVQALTQSTNISLTLFKSARADYMEVLLTQRDVLEAKMELIETKMLQMNAVVNTYRALGGGWN